jgi:CHAT domain-containing protein
MTADHQTTIRHLVLQPGCVDVVIGRLETLARKQRDEKKRDDGSLLSDLAAAYYQRAQRRDRPSDLLHAIANAEEAVTAAPASLGAKFNRALAQEALGFNDQAVASWDELRNLDHSPWGKEAADHWRRLTKAAAIAAATQWAPNGERLADPAIRNDSAALGRLIALYPLATQRYVEEKILPAWATASIQGHTDDAQHQLELAEVIAGQYGRLNGDQYLTDVIACIRAGRGQVLKTLQKAHLALRDARLDERARPQIAAIKYEQAQTLFETAGSPAAARSQLGHAITSFFNTHDPAHARQMLAPVEQLALARNYKSLLTRVELNRANFLFYEGDQVGAISHYDLALADATRMNDRENIANAHTRKAGILRVLGRNDLASREALVALRFAAGVADVPSRHLLLAENAAAASAHGFPGVALVYQNRAVLLIQTALSDPQLDKRQTQELRNNLASSLRGRAEILLHLEKYQAAQADLDDAIRLLDRPMNQSEEMARNALLSRIEEVQGQNAMKAGDPMRAAEAFSSAIGFLFPGEYRTFRALLFIERSEAEDALGDPAGAENDLASAINELRTEERRLLSGPRGPAEPFLAAYFSRFRDVHERLIQHLVDRNRRIEAFEIAEQSRAFEPLTLILQNGVTSEDFRRWTHDGSALSLATIQSKLPGNVFVVEFSVLPDRTYVWIVGQKYFDLITRFVQRDVIDQWSSALQSYVLENNADAVNPVLEESHAVLLAEALARIKRVAPPNQAARLVFVPDRSIHGLPLAALRDRESGRYVIDDHTVSVAASATFYLFSRDRDQVLARETAQPTALLVGDPAFNPRLELARNLFRLTWARNEVDSIEAIYGTAAVIKLRPDLATVPEFLRLAPQSVIVHFAGHAVANPDAPFRSLLLLAPSADDSGVLMAEDILARLRIDKTRLIVLSACSSAGGVPIGPEGLAPLVRPFIAAGVPAVVGSLWRVKDIPPSAELLIAFHQHFHDGEDAEEALRQAQLQIKKDYPSPLIWAPFQVIGHASSPYRKKGRS